MGLPIHLIRVSGHPSIHISDPRQWTPIDSHRTVPTDSVRPNSGAGIEFKRSGYTGQASIQNESYMIDAFPGACPNSVGVQVCCDQVSRFVVITNKEATACCEALNGPLFVSPMST
jgi:hypothetical protein